MLGDHPGCIGESVSAIRIDRFLEPIEMVALISRSAAVVGLSLHAAITALVHHVPVVRPIDYWIPKYSALTSFVSVLSYRNDALPTAQAVLRHIESFNGADVAVLSQRSALLAVHWDKVAALLVRRDGAVRALPWGNGTSRLLAEAISRGLGETTSQDHRIAEQSSHIKLLTERVEELQSQLASEREQRASVEIDRLHHQTMFEALTTSTSWKVTEPMRKIGRKLGRTDQSPDFNFAALPAVVGGGAGGW